MSHLPNPCPRPRPLHLWTPHAVLVEGKAPSCHVLFYYLDLLGTKLPSRAEGFYPSCQKATESCIQGRSCACTDWVQVVVASIKAPCGSKCRWETFPAKNQTAKLFGRWAAKSQHNQSCERVPTWKSVILHVSRNHRANDAKIGELSVGQIGRAVVVKSFQKFCHFWDNSEPRTTWQRCFQARALVFVP